MEGAKHQNASSLQREEESRVDMAVFALYPGGDSPHPVEEAERIRKESGLTSATREHIAFSCLSVAHEFMYKNRQTYQQLAREKSPQYGMREDDVLASMLHDMWAGCYSKALSLPEPLSVISLPSHEAKDLLRPRGIPQRFSMQTLQEAESPYVSGPSTYSSSTIAVVAAACLVVVVELVMFFVRRLPKQSYKASQEDRNALEAPQIASQNETPTQDSLLQEGTSEEKSKAAETQGIRTCIQGSGRSRRASIAGSTTGASRGGPRRTS